MAKHRLIQNFYASKPWITFRMTLINERGNQCQACGMIVAKSSDMIGHHTVELTPENVHDAMISLNPDLVDLICFDCHNKEHKRFGYNSSRQVYLVYGPPLSGKNTFVKQSMERGDLIVDMDLLYGSVSLLPVYDKPNTLLPIVLGMRNQLIDYIRTRYGKWNNAWVIGGYADKFQRDKLIQDLGAESIYCSLSKDECLVRLEAEESLKHRKSEWMGYIDKWFEQYRE